MYSSRMAFAAIFLALAATALAGVASHPVASASGPLPDHGEAQAAASSNQAGARAAASRLERYKNNALNAYGHHIGQPLLVKPYGDLTPLYAAALPPRTFVGQIQPAFYKDSYGNIKFQDESAIAVVAI